MRNQNHLNGERDLSCNVLCSSGFLSVTQCYIIILFNREWARETESREGRRTGLLNMYTVPCEALWRKLKSRCTFLTMITTQVTLMRELKNEWKKLINIMADISNITFLAPKLIYMYTYFEYIKKGSTSIHFKNGTMRHKLKILVKSSFVVKRNTCEWLVLTLTSRVWVWQLCLQNSVHVAYFSE